jgi:hypothetical protein
LSASFQTVRPDLAYILNVDELVFGSGNVGDIHVVGLTSDPFLLYFFLFPKKSSPTHGRRDILELLTGEDLFVSSVSSSGRH